MCLAILVDCVGTILEAEEKYENADRRRSMVLSKVDDWTVLTYRKAKRRRRAVMSVASARVMHDPVSLRRIMLP
jgi:hypothetical protein